MKNCTLSNPDEPKKVTEHKDIKDKGQTITFKEKPEVPEEPEKPETPPTPEKPNRPSDSPQNGRQYKCNGICRDVACVCWWTGWNISLQTP